MMMAEVVRVFLNIIVISSFSMNQSCDWKILWFTKISEMENEKLLVPSKVKNAENFSRCVAKNRRNPRAYCQTEEILK